MSVFAEYYLSEAYYYAHDEDRALASARKLAELHKQLGEPTNVTAMLLTAVSYAKLAAGRPAEAIEPARSAMKIYERDVLKDVTWQP